LTDTEHQQLQALARSRSAPADRIARAKALLAVDRGATFGQAATEAGWNRYQSVSDLILRFHGEGIDAVYGHHGGGPALEYAPEEQARILKEFQRTPDREPDQTAPWSLSTLQRALRGAKDGLPHVSTYVILQVLHQTGYSWQKDRTWCFTGTVARKRKDGVLTLTDPDALEKRGP
jgi:transposase